ncbi:hypothetical protein A9Q81_02620 [Gammaproteobacteria bacterium 42_54_T18]|nr:hypothetical protein A9Q81_02620 [Gammaproteobacteria bacterium 42_54_T18]
MNLSSHQDLTVFSTTEDLHSLHSTIESSNDLLEMQIEHSSQRAIKVSNAITQIMLANLEEENSDQQLQRHEQAEQIAYNLGCQEFLSTSHFGKSSIRTENPFSELNLQHAWDNGFTRSAIDNKNNHQKMLETQLWGNAYHSEQNQSQYAMAALALFTIAEQSTDTIERFRATQLANEMVHYTKQHQPTLKRQQEIDSFLSQQASRLAKELDF